MRPPRRKGLKQKKVGIIPFSTLGNFFFSKLDFRSVETDVVGEFFLLCTTVIPNNPKSVKAKLNFNA